MFEIVSYLYICVLKLMICFLNIVVIFTEKRSGSFWVLETIVYPDDYSIVQLWEMSPFGYSVGKSIQKKMAFILLASLSVLLLGKIIIYWSDYLK